MHPVVTEQEAGATTSTRLAAHVRTTLPGAARPAQRRAAQAALAGGRTRSRSGPRASPRSSACWHPGAGRSGYAIWKRDFTGACGFFGVVLRKAQRPRPLRADRRAGALRHRDHGADSSRSPCPSNPARGGSVTEWPHQGPCFRIHAGWESVEDLIADLEAGSSGCARSSCALPFSPRH